MNYFLKNMLSDGALLCPIYRTQCGKFLDHLDFHPHYEVYFCHSPLPQKMFINGQRYSVNTPNVVILPPFAVHHISLEAAGDGFERYVVYFNHDFLDQFGEAVLPKGMAEGFFGVMFPLSGEKADRILESLQNLYEKDASRGEQATGLALLLNRLERLVPMEERIRLEQTTPQISQILEYIYRNVDQDLSADALARRFNLSRAKLDRDFRQYVGQTVHQTVTECRLSAAAGLLRRTGLSVAEIASLCGFESEYYFYSFFKRNTGRTPSELRKNEADSL